MLSATGELKLNEFELAIMNRLALKLPGGAIDPGGLRVRDRVFTGTGSLTDFEVSEDAGFGPRGHIWGILIAIPGLPDGLWATLFTMGGEPERLEISTYKDVPWDGTHAGFVLLEDA